MSETRKSLPDSLALATWVFLGLSGTSFAGSVQPLEKSAVTSLATVAVEAQRSMGLMRPQLPGFIPAALLGQTLRPVTSTMQFIAPPQPQPVATPPNALEAEPDEATGQAASADRAVSADLPIPVDPFGTLTYLHDNGMAPAMLGFSRVVAAASTGADAAALATHQGPAEAWGRPLAATHLQPPSLDIEEPPAQLESAPTQYRFRLLAPTGTARTTTTTTEQAPDLVASAQADEAGADTDADTTSLASLRTAALAKLPPEDASAVAEPIELELIQPESIAPGPVAADPVPKLSVAQEPAAAPTVLPDPLKPAPLFARLRPKATEPQEPASQEPTAVAEAPAIVEPEATAKEAMPESKTTRDQADQPRPLQFAALVPKAAESTTARPTLPGTLSLPTTMLVPATPSGASAPPRQAQPPRQATPQRRVVFPQTAHLQAGLPNRAVLPNDQSGSQLTTRHNVIVPRATEPQPSRQRVVRLRLPQPPKPSRRPFNAETLEVDLVPGSKADRLATFLEGVSRGDGAAGQARPPQKVPFAQVLDNATQARTGNGVSLGRVAKHTISRNEQARRQDMVQTLRRLRTPGGLAF